MESNPGAFLAPVRPVRPVAPYIGGKKSLAKRVASRIADVPHRTYAEVFVGMGGVFFRREQQPKSEVINDWSEDVSTFFRILQHHYVAFMDMLKWQVTSRAMRADRTSACAICSTNAGGDRRERSIAVVAVSDMARMSRGGRARGHGARWWRAARPDGVDKFEPVSGGAIWTTPRNLLLAGRSARACNLRQMGNPADDWDQEDGAA